jgi:membrane fusion protein, heavy metal efflux system
MNSVRTLGLAMLAAALLILPACGGRDSQEAENTANSEAADFCEEHQIAESQCPWCDPNLIVSLGFCYGHGVPEAYCYLCNPALIPAFKAVGDWCAGHDRPESQCYICNPELDPERDESTRTEAKDSPTESVPDDWTNGGVTDYNSRTQRPPSVVCSTEDLIVRFDDPEIAQQAGLEYSKVESRRITKTVECNADIAYDGDRFAHVSAQMPGIVAEVHKSFGEVVDAGEALVTIKSAQLGATKAKYLQAIESLALWTRNHARESDLLERGVSTEKDLLEAETRLAESRIVFSESEQALLSFGLGREEIEEVKRSKDTSADYRITTPFSGIVVDRFITIGEVVDTSKPLFAVADLSRMWAFLNIYESDLREIRVGQPVVFQVEGLQDRAVAGYITWVSSRLDPKTRTLQARVELDNVDGILRANMFAQASISVRNRQQALVVPEAAVQWEGCCNVVFIKTLDAVYQPRKVHLGVHTGTVYEVLSGVDEGEEVVTQGSFLLKTEILKNSIGAGCCEVNPGA